MQMFIYKVEGDVMVRFLPGYQRVPSSESGRVQLKDGGDVVAVGDRNEGVRDLLVGCAQTSS